MAWFLLIVCIVLETISTTLLKLSNGFTKPFFGISAIAIFAIIFYLLSIVFKQLPVCIAYAVWGGLGMVLIAIIGIVVFAEKPDIPAIIGITMIVSGVLIMGFFSKMSVH